MRWFGLLLLVGCAASDPGGTDDGIDTDDGRVDDSGEVGTECEVGLSPGDCAPDFTLLNADGESVTLSELKGRRLVVLGSSLW